MTLPARDERDCLDLITGRTKCPHPETLGGLAKDCLFCLRALIASVRLGESGAIKKVVQTEFDSRADEGPSESRIALSWVLACIREREAALREKVKK